MRREILSSLIENYRTYIKNKKVAVLGIGVSNTPLIKFLKAWMWISLLLIKQNRKTQNIIDRLKGIKDKV